MKQTLFMVAIMAATTFGAVIHPFWAVLLYYFFAVLRPQFIWQWSLPEGMRWSLMAAGILAFAVVAHLNSIWRKLDLNPIAIVLALFVLWTGASVLTAFDPQVSLYWLETLVKIAGVAVLSIYLIDRFSHLRLLTLMILIASGYIAYEQNYKYFVHGRLDIYHYGYGGLDNNGAALSLAIAIPLAYSFVSDRLEGIWRLVRWIAPAAALLIIHTVLLSYSRGAMLASLCGLGWVALNHRPRRHALVGVGVLTVLVLAMAGTEVRTRFLSIQDFEQDGSATRRLAAWDAAWDMAWDQPLFGYGLRNSTQFIRHFSDDTVAPVVHSQYLQVAADSGIPALVLLVVLLGLCMHRLRSSRLACIDALNAAPAQGLADAAYRRRLQSGRDLWLGLEAALLTLIVGQLFLSFEVVELPWLLYAIAAASPRIAEALIRSDQPEPEPAPDRPRRGVTSQDVPQAAAAA